jgi:hypothetical protein
MKNFGLSKNTTNKKAIHARKHKRRRILGAQRLGEFFRTLVNLFRKGNNFLESTILIKGLF